METKRIDAALREARDTRCLVIGTGALASVDATFEQCFGQQPAVVADENTFAVAGRTVQEQLQATGREQTEPIVFPGAPTLYANFANVLFLESRLRAHDAIPVVVGSGTLNDITKLASHRAGRKYMCVGTAASMDGYTAFGAAITKDGFKQTMSCPAPRAVLADLDILVNAPPEMNATGYGANVATWWLTYICPLDGREPHDGIQHYQGKARCAVYPEGALPTLRFCHSNRFSPVLGDAGTAGLTLSDRCQT